MCGGAILAARVKKVIWATRDIRVGANGSWIDIFKEKYPIHKVEIQGGLLEEEAAYLLRKFFKKRRS